MPDLNSAIRAATYAQKQIFSRDSLVAWSHGRRFDTALRLARGFQGRRVLDFGSGDGTFLAAHLHRYDAVFCMEVPEHVVDWAPVLASLSRLLAELLSAVFAGPRLHVVRPVFNNPDGQTHDHKGFNWKVLLEWLKEPFEVDRVLSSPVPMLGPSLATQVWFVARPRIAPAAGRLRP